MKDEKGLVNMEEKTEKFYEEDWFLVLMLFLFAPVGIFLLWFNKKFTLAWRIGITIFVSTIWMLSF